MRRRRPAGPTGGHFLTTAVVAEDPRASLEPALGTARYYGLGPAAARGVLAEVSASFEKWREEARRFGAGRAEVDRMASASSTRNGTGRGLRRWYRGFGAGLAGSDARQGARGRVTYNAPRPPGACGTPAGDDWAVRGA